MKYGFYINQLAVIDNGLKLDIVDLAIFDCIKDFTASPNCKKLVDGERIYYWLKWTWLSKECPILGLNTRQSVTGRYNKLIDAKMLIAHPDNQKLQQAFYCFGENYNLLCSVNKSLHGVNKNLHGVSESLQVSVNESLHHLATDVYTDNNTNNNTTNNNSSDFEKSPEPTQQKDSLKQPKHLESFLAIIEHLNKQSGRSFQITENDKKGKTDKYKLVAKLLDQKYKESDFIEVINAKVIEWGNDAKMCQYLQPATLFAQRNFERYLEALKAGALQPKTQTNQPPPAPNEPPIQDPKKEAWYQKTLEFMKQCNPNFYINRMQFEALFFGNIYDIPPTSIDRMVRKKVPIWSTKNNIFDLLMGELNRLLQISYNGI